MYEEENPQRPIGFGFNVDRSDVFGVNVVLRKRGYTSPDNNMELKRVKEELASQKAMFLLILKAMHNGKITDEFLDATEAALRMAGDQVLSLENALLFNLLERNAVYLELWIVFQNNKVETTLAMNRGTLDLQPQPHKLISQLMWACSRLSMT
ncbi:hypothetical protein Cgig2_017161 [Carnegiea gigantea]|uniref:Uncharacterized protein n=1 Tax=Carnegiea gigantea TaxID=171969 RepID=A0A9Q1QD47_9CARY|nr:hypothetical protein Cgig2_017161 [Carnegiea gigantea]